MRKDHVEDTKNIKVIKKRKKKFSVIHRSFNSPFHNTKKKMRNYGIRFTLIYHKGEFKHTKTNLFFTKSRMKSSLNIRIMHILFMNYKQMEN